MIKLVTFLGNPGIEHEQTRHNIGWMMADNANFIRLLSWQNKFKGTYAASMFNRQKVFFLKPETFMNKSGESVQSLMRFFKIFPANLLVVHDEIELEYGQVDFKKGGGLAGHNGLRSIATMLKNQDFYRLRLGVSRPVHGDVSSYVLGKFSEEERIDLSGFLDKGVDALDFCLNKGVDSAIRKFKKKKVV